MHFYAITNENVDTMKAHLSRKVCQGDIPGRKLHAKKCVGERLLYDATDNLSISHRSARVRITGALIKVNGEGRSASLFGLWREHANLDLRRVGGEFLGPEGLNAGSRLLYFGEL